MGNTAIVAFRNTNGSYDLHRSPDGATNFQLLVPLSIAATSDDTRYRDFVASLDAPESALDTQGGLDYQFLEQRARRGDTVPGDADPSTLLEADPYATDLAAVEIMEHLKPGVEHLYVVDDGLDLYYPAWCSIGLLAWFTQTVRIEAYDRDRIQSAGQIESLVSRSPDHVYEGNDFEELAVKSDTTSDWYQLFRDNFQPIGANVVQDAIEYDAHDNTLSRVRVLRPEWVFVIEPLGATIKPPGTDSRALYPIHIPFETEATLEDVSSGLAEVRTDVQDTALYLDGMMLATGQPVEQDAVRARVGEMFLDNIQDAYGTRLATKFLPF